MTVGRLFVKLDVDYPDNPKMIAAAATDPLSEVLYVRGLCLAKKMLKDGYLDPLQLGRMGLPEVEKLAEILVDSGLWKHHRTGYKIVGWLDRNPSAKEIQDLSKKKAEAGRAGGKASGRSRGASGDGKQEPF